MLHNLIKNIIDGVFGNSVLRGAMLGVFGYRWIGWVVGLLGYRAIHMVSKGETCLLAGIYNTSTIVDFSRVVGESGKVLVVEANPENTRRLAAETRKLKNVRLVNRAVWNKAGKMEFICSLSDKDQGYNRLNAEELNEFPLHMDEKPETVMVQTDSLDVIAAEQDVHRVDHVNLTINGAELQALEGLYKLRDVNPDIRVYINSETPSPALDVLRELREHGFTVNTSHLIRVVNKQIRLVRIYACR